MSPKQIGKLLTPPLIVSLIRRSRRKASGTPSPEWEFVGNDWKSATASVTAKGWALESVAQAYRERWSKFLGSVEGTAALDSANARVQSATWSHNVVMTFAYVVGLAALESQAHASLSVLDYGGGVGDYFILARALFPQLQLDYHCVEVAQVVQVGMQVLPGVTFHSSPDWQLRRYDLVFANASFQYAEDWRAALGQFAGVTGRYLLIIQLPVVKRSASFIALQRAYSYGYDTEYINWVLNEAEFLDCASEQGLELLREFNVGLQPDIVYAPEQCEYRGYLFRPRHQGS